MYWLGFQHSFSHLGNRQNLLVSTSLQYLLNIRTYMQLSSDKYKDKSACKTRYSKLEEGLEFPMCYMLQFAYLLDFLLNQKQTES